MADKQPENDDGIFELIKKIWLPIAGFLGAITLAYNFYKLWLGDQTTVTYFLAGGGLVLFIVAMIFVITRTKTISQDGAHPLAPATKHKVPYYSPSLRKLAKGGISLVIILAIGGVFLLIQHREEQKKYLSELEQKLVVVIAAFEGPEDVYGLRNQIIENLNSTFSNDENIEIILIDEIITLTKGSEYARELGKNYLADVVIWGWYRPTENPNIHIHIENLFSSQLLTLEESETFQPIATIAELESFSFQQQTGNEASALISFLAGFIEYQSENYEVAIKYFNSSLGTLSETTIIFENLVEVYFYQGNSNLNLTNYENAIQDYNQAIQIDSQYAVVYNNRGITYFNLGNYELAVRDYSQAIKIVPEYSEAYNNRGNAYSKLSDYEKAIQNYDKAIELNPNIAEFYNNRGGVYRKFKKYDKAFDDFNKSIQLNPNLAMAYFNRGIAYNDLLESNLAIQDFDKAIQINPTYAEAFNSRGIAYSNLGNFKVAIENYDQAIQINPYYLEAYNNRGIDYYNLGDYESAINNYNQALNINSNDELVYNNRGNAYSNLGEYEKAIQDYTQAIRINSNIPEFYNSRGIAYSDLSNYEQAIQDYTEAIQIRPNYAYAYYNRGLAYQALGKTAEAEADFAKYKELTGKDAP